jgi:hypothetical protein
MKGRAPRARLLVAEFAARQRPSSETDRGSRGRDCSGSFRVSLADRGLRTAVIGRCSLPSFSECGEDKRLEVGPE